MNRNYLIRRCPDLALILTLSFAMPAAAQTSSSKSSNPTAASTQSRTHTAAKHAGGSSTAKTSAHKPTSHAAPSSHSRKGSKKTAKKRGQQVIDSGRTTEIQQALIREHYLTGEPSGSWDSTTQAAMQRYQEDQGWQSKTTPDSRALIKLGLGPSHDHLLNPETAMTSPTGPASPGDPRAETKQTPSANAAPQQ